jgi:hypothetical protein
LNACSVRASELITLTIERTALFIGAVKAINVTVTHPEVLNTATALAHEFMEGAICSMWVGSGRVNGAVTLVSKVPAVIVAITEPTFVDAVATWTLKLQRRVAVGMGCGGAVRGAALLVSASHAI